MTNSLSYRLVVLVWIDRMHNKWMNESRISATNIGQNCPLFFKTFAHIKLILSGNWHELSLLHVWCTVHYIVQKMEIYVIKQSASVCLSVMASLIRMIMRFAPQI